MKVKINPSSIGIKFSRKYKYSLEILNSRYFDRNNLSKTNDVVVIRACVQLNFTCI